MDRPIPQRCAASAKESASPFSPKNGYRQLNLSRLENSPHATPTLDTLDRYARALGMTVHVELITARAA